MSAEKTERTRILIVEDERDIRNALKEILDGEGYAVTVMSDGAEALWYLRSAPRPALILLDLIMPVMNGLRFFHEIKKIPSLATIPVALLSATADEGAFHTIRADALIKKPVDITMLLERVRRITGGPRSGAGASAAQQPQRQVRETA